MTADQIAELAALRELVDPHNPLSRQLIDERIRSGKPADAFFFGMLQKAWRDGHLSESEIELCRQLGIDARTYLLMRKVADPLPGESRFDAVRRRLFEL
jgi:hypothetical protein